jgi:hypothetical protein
MSIHEIDKDIEDKAKDSNEKARCWGVADGSSGYLRQSLAVLMVLDQSRLKTTILSMPYGKTKFIKILIIDVSAVAKKEMTVPAI